MTRPVLPDPHPDIAGAVTTRETEPLAGRDTGHVTGQLTSADRPHLLSEAARALFGSLHVERTVARLLGLVVPALADWGQVVVVKGRSLECTGTSADGTALDAVTRAPADLASGVARVLTTGRTQLVHVADPADHDPDPADHDSDPTLAAFVPDPGLRASAAALRPADLLALPLTGRATTFGVLVLARRAGRGFDQDDVTLCEELARLGAGAVDSARLYAERTHVADVLSRSLRPPTLPQRPGTRIAARLRTALDHIDVGGDFYDVHGPDHDWTFVVGDVCGKGVEAAVLTGKARQAVRTAALVDRSPDRVLALTDSTLSAEVECSDDDRFITMLAGRVRPAGEVLEVDLACAGHPPPYVVRSDGSIDVVPVDGIVAGLGQGGARPVVRVTLGRLDTLFCYTDGTTEARGADGFFGTERLTRLLPLYRGAPPEALVEAVDHAVVQHLDGRPHDDIALFAVHRERG
ncbi:MAG TPA: SpoIIE family protein phosphatase [Jiangellales bacterium]|nr:SpoIIE family protein phosphatase [Jiangellales bacterium]